MSDERRGRGFRHGLPGLRGQSLLVIAALLAGCATPLRPSGGPEDRTPPELIASTPAPGAVRVSDRRVVLTFSERVDEASVRRALSVAPASARGPEVRVRGRDVEIVVPDSLRTDVTYVLTLGTDLRDLHGVAIGAPVTLAFATGDRIDEGRLRGTVRNAATGRAIAGTAVLAYRLGVDSTAALPDPRVAAADYRSQTGSDGAFVLSYLRPGPYFVIALDDRNRDGLAGAGEAFAAPPARAVVATDTGAAPPPFALHITRVDTTGPVLRGAGVGPGGVVTARFDEPVQVGPGAEDAFAIEDSATARALEIAAVWTAAGGGREVAIAATPITPMRYRLRLNRGEAVTDTSGNMAATGSVSFAGAPAIADTIRADFAAFLPDGRVPTDSAYALRADERAGVRFSGPVDSLDAQRMIALRDRGGAALPYRAIRENPTTYLLEPDAPEFIVTVVDSTHRRRYRRPAEGELGGIAGRVEGAGAAAALIEVFADGAAASARPYTARAGAGGAFALSGLLPGSYRVRVLVDSDADGSWDGGRLAPYVPPETVGWLPDPVRVRARWETDLGTMRIDAGFVSADGVEPE